MPTPPAALAVLVLLASAPAIAQSSLVPPETGGGRQLLLSVDALEQEHEVRIGPDTSINLFFDAPVWLVGLEERERFRRVEVTGDSITLMASRELKPGQRLRMPVRFMDGTAPVHVDFVLVVVPAAEAERQVEVYRPKAPVSCQEQAREEREKARQCQENLERERAEPRGLTGLLAPEQMDDKGVLALRLEKHSQPVGQALNLRRAISYRVTRPGSEDEKEPKVARVAVMLWVENESPQPWAAAGAELVSEDGVRRSLSVWQQGPIVPGKRRQRVVVEAELLEAETRGTFTLELWEEGRVRSVTFGGVSFP